LSRNIVSILNYRPSRGILNIGNYLEKARKRGKVQPKNWENSLSDFRSLTIYDDGSCLLHSLSAASMIRRLEKTRL